VATVLIELPGGEGIVRRDDGEIVLTHDVTLDWGQPLQPWDRYQPIRIGLSDERMLFGGLLPPGAVSVEAIAATGVCKAAAVGAGTYAVIFEDREHSEPALGYRDAAGAFVHRPMPAEYPHQPVTDTEEPCPVCGAIQYEEYFPTEDWRGGRGRKGSDSFVPSPLIVCRVCGHQERAGGIMRLGQPDNADEDADAREARMARIRAEQDVHRWYANKMTLMGVTFPIYAAEGWPARINGQGSQGDDLTHLRIAHAETLPDSMFVQRPRIEVTTSIDPHQPGELAASLLRENRDLPTLRPFVDECCVGRVALDARHLEQRRPDELLTRVLQRHGLGDHLQRPVRASEGDATLASAYDAVVAVDVDPRRTLCRMVRWHKRIDCLRKVLEDGEVVFRLLVNHWRLSPAL
jgi:hypothetical protein